MKRFVCLKRIFIFLLHESMKNEKLKAISEKRIENNVDVNF